MQIEPILLCSCWLISFAQQTTLIVATHAPDIAERADHWTLRGGNVSVS